MIEFATKHILATIVIVALGFFWFGFFVGVIMAGISERDNERMVRDVLGSRRDRD